MQTEQTQQEGHTLTDEQFTQYIQMERNYRALGINVNYIRCGMWNSDDIIQQVLNFPVNFNMINLENIETNEIENEVEFDSSLIDQREVNEEENGEENEEENGEENEEEGEGEVSRAVLYNPYREFNRRLADVTNRANRMMLRNEEEEQEQILRNRRLANYDEEYIDFISRLPYIEEQLREGEE